MNHLALAFDAESIELSGKNLIEASAGTGKTHAITVLFERLVVERRLEPAQILVVTFTEAATVELRDRVRRRLFESVRGGAASAGSDGAVEPPSRRLVRALESVDEAPIATIHAFCQRVLAERALESGVPLDAELTPDLDELYDDVLYDFWRSRVSHGPPELARALSQSKTTPAVLRQLLRELSKNPALRLVPPPDQPDQSLRLKHEFARYARPELRRRKDERRVLGFDDLLERLLDALRAPEGTGLARALRDRYRAVLIDEFQDTDPTQCEIFERAFGGGGHPLFLIGDPKQAIYGFRGADVRSYLDASRSARRFTMGTSWRSDPGLVAAVNQLFSGADPFRVPDILHRPLAPRPGVDEGAFVDPGGGSAFEIVLVERDPREDERAVMLKAKGRLTAARAVAADIVELLRRGARIGERPVTERDIAVLTRDNEQCFIVQDALREKGVHSVVLGDRSVFEYDEAADIEQVLSALLEPGRSSELRTALATSLFGVTGEELTLVETDPQALLGYSLKFREWNAIWAERGFMRMFRALLDGAGTAERLLATRGGERRLTNVLHIAELLHRVSLDEHLGPAALVRWLADQRVARKSYAEHSEVRLESDEQAVRILTAHRSKGLEYSIVYCPYLWASKSIANDGTPRPFHDENGGISCNIHPERKPREKHHEIARAEQFAEELRLCYVALTRARHRTLVFWGGFRYAGGTAPAEIFFPRPERERAALPKPSRLDSLSDDELADALGTLAQGAPSISVRRLPWGFDPPALERQRKGERELAARRIERPVTGWARTDSFTALVRHQAHAARDVEGIDHDERPLAEELSAKDGASSTSARVHAPTPSVAGGAGERERIVLDGFPRGPVSGELFHSILEEIDFETASPEDLLDLGTQKLEAYGLTQGRDLARGDALRQQVVAALARMLETELSPVSGLRLRDVPLARRMSELEFHLPVARGPDAELLTRTRLARVFREHPSPELPADYAERVERLGFAPLYGFLKGYIDLVFEHRGLFYVVDYKSNHLGDFVDEYDAARMGAAMAESHYFLQYHLYSVAVARLLARHGAAFDYERAFGGVFYLFLKGMRPGSSTGVFFEKPPRARIEALSRALGGQSC